MPKLGVFCQKWKSWHSNMAELKQFHPTKACVQPNYQCAVESSYLADTNNDKRWAGQTITQQWQLLFDAL